MNKKIKKYKVGIDSETYAISMVESPAIESDFVALSKEEDEKLQVMLDKDERHMVYGAVLIPDKEIYRNNGEQEFYISFTKESIEKMSQDFMKNYRQNEVTLDHEDMANDVTIVETWLVEDPYKDKANALGITAPKGTWMAGMKVNQIDVWERIKGGELKGFSVESMISLEEFSRQNTNNMNIETNDNMFWDKMKNILSEVFTSLSMSDSRKEDTNLSENSLDEAWSKPYPASALTDPQNIELASISGFTNVEDYLDEVHAIREELEEQNAQAEPNEAVSSPSETSEPVETDNEPQETKEEPTEPGIEEKPQDNSQHLEELINNLKEEINALKEMNNGLNDKIKELSKEPSAKPINPNSKPNGSDTYSAWREQMRGMIG